jgi:hypothetical protein
MTEAIDGMARATDIVLQSTDLKPKAIAFKTAIVAKTPKTAACNPIAGDLPR